MTASGRVHCETPVPCREVDDVRDLLALADGSSVLPRLGGMARPDGVVIASERFWALARRDGCVVEGRMPGPKAWLRRVPLVRGLVRLCVAFAPLVRGSGVARPGERFLLGAATIGPLGLLFVSPDVQTFVSVGLAVALIGWLFRGRTLQLHGAEHRAIEAVERRQMASTWEGACTPPRFSRRCGTNLACLTLLLVAVLYLFTPIARDGMLSLPLGVGVLAVTMEIWFVVQASERRIARVLLMPGLAMQRLTTREPSIEETRLALLAAASVIRRELV